MLHEYFCQIVLREVGQKVLNWRHCKLLEQHNKVRSEAGMAGNNHIVGCEKEGSRVFLVWAWIGGWHQYPKKGLKSSHILGDSNISEIMDLRCL